MLTRRCELTLAVIGLQVLAMLGVSAVARSVSVPVDASASASANGCPKCSIVIEWESLQVNKSTEDNAMERYRIHWKSLKTGATGHGTGSFSRSEAQKIADDMNRENDGLLVHWIEPVGGLESELKSGPESEPLTPMECPAERKCI